MDQETKRKKIRRYFQEFPWWTIVCLVLGLIIILIGVETHWRVSIVVGVFLIGVGAAGIIASQPGKPSDNQIDDWLEFDRQTLVTRSKVKLALDESQIVSDGYELFIWLWLGLHVDRHGIPDEDIKQKRGKLPCNYSHFYYNRVRHSAWQFQVFYPTEHYLASYGCALDFLRGEFVRETTAEIYYKDITILETGTEDRIDPTDKGLKKSKRERFTLKVLSGDAITIWIPSEYLINQELKDGVSEVPSTQCEKMVQSMRKIVQPKKSQ